LDANERLDELALRMTDQPIVVLGAGVAGVCTALELARRGRRVTIIDQAPDCLLRASFRAEGKIHLGLVYAHDPSLRTLELMLEGALRFDRIVERLVGERIDWEKLRSSAFLYAVLPGSLCSADELAATYSALQDQYDRRIESDSFTYIGTRPRTLSWPVPEGVAREWLAPEVTDGVFGTAEFALDLSEFRRLLQGALERAEGVERRWHHRIESVDRTASGYRLEGATRSGEAWALEAAVVVNCVWEDRLRLDAQLGLAPRRPWVHRLKYRVLGRLPSALADLPSFTFVLGPFGDIVTWPSGRVYLSWYPACLRGWCSDLKVPEAWQAPCGGETESDVARDVIDSTLGALSRITPGLGAITVETVDAGIITAWGATDVDDPDSTLHQRHEIGPWAHDGWISVDTGKLTTAPLFAERAAALAIEADA
jgi:glycine/D-amino acid oxidase-like deaminating enzyme